MEFMNKQSQELELRNIMQGIEEFATFMSFRGNSTGLRILSVESIDQPVLAKPEKRKASLIKLSKLDAKQTVNKALSFQNIEYH